MRFNVKMLGYCGVYCEQCAKILPLEEQTIKHFKDFSYPLTQRDLDGFECDGCKGEHCFCNGCKFKPCASSKGFDSCADCDIFPCEHIEAFANDGFPHHKNAVMNLHIIREHGVDYWYKNLKPALTCQCGERQTYYYTCPIHNQVSSIIL